jgi:hypothetical protein
MGKGITGHERPFRGKTNEWYTPPYITEALGHFDLDPCAGKQQEWNIADKKLTETDDGLIRPWYGRVWLNPPYGEKTKLWLKKMSRHMNGIVLIFARTETKMYHQYVWPFVNSVFFFEGRIKFLDEKGNPSTGSAGAPSCLLSYDLPGVCVNHDAIKQSKLKGKFISLLGK